MTPPNGEDKSLAPDEFSIRSQPQQGAVEYQFQDNDGKWCWFLSERHRDDTIADGRWPIRALYTHPPTIGQPALDDAIAALREAGKDLLDAYDHESHPFVAAGAAQRMRDALALTAALAAHGKGG